MIVDKTRHDVETWENISAGVIMVNKFSGKGDEVIQEPVASGRKILVSPQERSLLNSDRCYSKSVDAFNNGRLIPVSLASDSDDLIESENPNHMSTSDIEEIFKVRNWKKFQKVLSEISSVPILTLMTSMAEADAASDDSVLNVTVKQSESIRSRLNDLIDAPDVGFVESFDPGVR